MHFTIVSHGKPATFRDNQPKPCCVPDQFSALISGSDVIEVPNVGPVALYGAFNFSYDANRGMYGMKGRTYSVIDKTDTSVWIIGTISEKQTYAIDLNSKKCVKDSISVAPFRCIPESATYLYSSMYGFGDNQFKGDTWFIEDNNAVSFVTVSSDGNCIPLNGNNFISTPPGISTMTLANYVPKINDPSIFDIPDECKNAV
ncbi:unnamed protein product [Rotaria sordida]|uniref:Uncharacterized protein n=1 Tax=Rotaria sordida TaxID=392033 RepID=A0A815E4X0_9BILA|nr:unnamed protein product [Rotaria sordida]CAF1342170.1 unnamed protein product [Rotaria sordida]CAF1370110.1 unnamed protein product [Rotaria sordida]CAF1375981.1 unnamed protein product [Rotaria sordida]CAF1613877.1 unnamed protein product [Rotaria sordida]